MRMSQTTLWQEICIQAVVAQLTLTLSVNKNFSRYGSHLLI